MATEMRRFIAWLAATAPDGKIPLPAPTRAAVTHLYCVRIHPFEDGNGRIAWALAEKALLQVIGQPSLIALSHIIQRKCSAYCKALEAAK
nr:Fic family protein [Sphingomonas sp. CDS-1]